MPSFISWEMCEFFFQSYVYVIESIYLMRGNVHAWCSFHLTLELKDCEMELEGM